MSSRLGPPEHNSVSKPTAVFRRRMNDLVTPESRHLTEQTPSEIYARRPITDTAK